MWLLLIAVFFSFLVRPCGAVNSVYDSADHFWDFEQTPVGDAIDLRTSRSIIAHEHVQEAPSPSQNGIKVTENAWVDLNLDPSRIPCLLDPSNCTNNLTVSMLLKNRPHTFSEYKHLFGNPLVHTYASRGISVSYRHHKRQLDVKFVGSEHYCHLTSLWLPEGTWIHLIFIWTKSGTLTGYKDSKRIYGITCGEMSEAPHEDNFYSLGYMSKSNVYYDNLAIWYRALSYVETNSIWQSLRAIDGGETSLNVEMTMNDMSWNGELNNPSSHGFSTLKDQIETGITKTFNGLSTFISVYVSSFSEGSVKANITLRFKSFRGRESLSLAEALCGGNLITDSSNVTVTQCSADNVDSCMPLRVHSVVATTSNMEITFEEPNCSESTHHRGYVVLYKKTIQEVWSYRRFWSCFNDRGVLTRDIFDLDPYTNYSVTIMAVSFQGTNIPLWPPIAVLTGEDKPSEPPRVTKVEVSDSGVTVEWDPASIPEKAWRGNPQGFTVTWESEGCSDIIQEQYPLDVSSHVIQNLRENLIYRIKVMGRNGAGNGEPNVTLARTHPAVLRGLPENITIFNTSTTSLKIQWDEVDQCERQSYVLGYNLNVTDIEGGVSLANLTVYANETRRVDLSNLSIYWMYGVRIQGYSHLGVGPYSKEYKAKTGDSVPIVAPYNVSVHVTSSQSIRVHWKFDNKVRNVLGELTGFRVFYAHRSGDSGTTMYDDLNSVAETTEIAELDIDMWYNVSVTAMTRIGHGPLSVTVEVLTGEEAPGHPPHPIILFNISSTSLQAEWGTVPVGFRYGVILGYRVSLQPFNQTLVTLEKRNFSLLENSTKFLGLKKFTAYTVSILAYSKSGDGIAGHISASTDEDVPTLPPGNLSAYHTSSTRIQVVWQYVPWCCRYGIIQGYRLFLRDNRTLATVVNAAFHDEAWKSVGIIYLQKYHWYRVSILAFTVKGDGPESAQFSVRTGEGVPIKAPYNVTGHNTSSTSLVIHWEFDPAERYVIGIHRGFSVYHKNMNDTRSSLIETIINDPGAVLLELKSLKKYRHYRISVAGRSGAGAGLKSREIILRTDEDVPISPPSNVRGSNTSSTSLRVAWHEVPFPDQLGIIRGYRGLFWMTNQSDVILHNETVNPERRTLNFSGLEFFTNYTFQVMAFTVKGSGPASPPLTVITDEDLPSRKPETVVARNTSSTSIVITWQPLVDDHYVHGILRGYNLSYHRTDGRGPQRNMLLCETQLFKEIPGLDKFTKYTLQVRAFNTKGDGPAQEVWCITDQDAPTAPPQNFIGYHLTKHDILVVWSPVPKNKTNGVILGYRVFFKETRDSDAKEYNLTVNYQDTNVTLTSLRPFTSHSIQLLAFTVKGDGPKSAAIVVVHTEDEVLEPRVVPWNLTGNSTSSTNLYIRWGPIPPERVTGVLRMYRVLYDEINDLGEVVRKRFLSLSTSTLFVELRNLTRYTNYNVEVQGVTTYPEVRSLPIRITTAEDVPSRPPQNPRARSISSTSLLITWKPITKEFIHGILRGYRIFFTRKDKTRRRKRETVDGKVFTVLPNTTFLLVENLNKFAVYTYSVLGFTVMGDGRSSEKLEIATDEDVPGKAPPDVHLVNQTAPHKITVFWRPLPTRHVHGRLLGYRVLYTKIRVAGEHFPGLMRIKNVDQWTLQTTLEDVDNFAVYRISVLAFTVKGNGPPSEATYAETCRCRKTLSTNWYVLDPYVSYTNATIDGIFPFVLEPAIAFCCKLCTNGHRESVIDYVHDGWKKPAAKRANLSDVMRNINHDTDLNFPLVGFSGQEKYGIHNYVGLLESGGVAYVVRAVSSDERANAILQTVAQMAPILLLTVLVLIVVGMIMWMLDRGSMEYSPSFIKGTMEGAWWAFITMTTVGYGDKTARSPLGRLFAIAWTLTGLVISSILVAEMTNNLLSYTVNVSNKRVYGTKVAAIYDSAEYRLGVRKNARVDKGSKYHTYEDIKDALINKEVDGALLDLYIYSNNQKLFSLSSLRIVDVLDFKTTYGVVMAGDTMKLQKCISSYVQYNREKVFRYIEENIRIVEKQVPILQEVSSRLFDSESKQFFQCTIMTGLLLAFALVCGSVYEVYRRKVQRNKVAVCNAEIINTLKKEMTLKVSELHENVRILVNDMKRKHTTELRHLLSLKGSRNDDKMCETELTFTRKDSMKNIQEEMKKLEFEAYS